MFSSVKLGQPQLAVAAQIPKDIPRVDRTAGTHSLKMHLVLYT